MWLRIKGRRLFSCPIWFSPSTFKQSRFNPSFIRSHSQYPSLRVLHWPWGLRRVELKIGGKKRSLQIKEWLMRIVLNKCVSEILKKYRCITVKEQNLVNRATLLEKVQCDSRPIIRSSGLMLHLMYGRPNITSQSVCGSRGRADKNKW